MQERRDRAERAVQASEADFVEVRLESISTLELAQIGRRGSSVGPVLREGCTVRALVSGRWGYSWSSGFSCIEALVDRAAGAAVTAGKGSVSFNVDSPERNSFMPGSTEPFTGTPLKDKAFLCRHYCELLGMTNPAASARVDYSEILRDRVVVNSAGTSVREVEELCGLRLQTALPGNVTAFRSLAYRGGLENLRHREDLVREMTEDLSLRINSSGPTPGHVPAVLGPELTGMLVHEAFGHLAESDILGQCPALAALVSPGRRVGSECLSITDDPTHFTLPGSCSWDDEGTRGTRTSLVRGGVVKSRLHTLSTASNIGVTPTGNARAWGTGSIPTARMRCTILEPGEGDRDHLLTSMETGVYLKGCLGGATDMERFSLIAESGWTVRRGKIDRPMGPVVITGNVFDVLKAIDRVGEDIQLFGNMGGCGRAGESAIPVSYGGPHILVTAIRIG
ncbi:MAG: TldD/PmbA family protein [Candidatus Fermentibacteraceae bacterium]